MKNKEVFILIGVAVIIALGIFIHRNWQDSGHIQKAEKQMTEKQNQKQEVKKEASDKNDYGKMSGDDYGDPNSDIVYFYGRECPHCKKVGEFLDKNDIYHKVDFAKKEVWHNKDNGKELMQAAQKCGIDPSGVGVPFLFAKGECYIGDADVIAYFKEKAGM